MGETPLADDMYVQDETEHERLKNLCLCLGRETK